MGKLPKSYEKWKETIKQATKLIEKMDKNQHANKEVLLLIYDLKKATFKFSHDFEQTLPLPKKGESCVV